MELLISFASGYIMISSCLLITLVNFILINFLTSGLIITTKKKGE